MTFRYSWRLLGGAVLALILFFGFLSCGRGYKTPALVPLDKAEEGPIIDLSAWSFEKKGPVRIFGNSWEFYWNRLYSPDDFRYSRISADPVIVTGGDPWNGLRVDGRELSSDGFATYRVYIEMPKEEGLYSFYIKNQDSAYRLWINGELSAENGTVAETESEYVPQRLPTLFHYHAHQERFEIIVQVANFTHKWGGLTNSIYAGLTNQIRTFVAMRNGIILFLSGAIFIIACYHLFLYINRRKDKASLYFGLFCATVFFWYTFNGDYLFFRVFPDFPLAPGIRFNYASLFGILPLFLLFMHEVYPKQMRRVFTIVPVGISLCLIVFTVTAPVKLFGKYTLIPYYSLVVLGSGLVFIRIVRALRNGQPSSTLSLIGFLVFVLTVFYDIAANRKIILGSALSPFLPAGLFIFILFQSFILANRFSRTYEKLDEFADNLEQMVYERTEELRKTRKELMDREKLAALGTLAGGIYHEIFNPLSGISGPLSIIRKKLRASGEGRDEIVHRHLDNIQTSVDSITQVVRSLNDLIHESRIETHPVVLLPIVERVVDRYVQSRGKRIRFTVIVDSAEQIRGNSDVLYHILDNLVSNSVDAIEDEGSITIRTGENTEGKILIVEDSGHGISVGNADRVFDPFFTTKETFGGSGLGLFLVKKYAAALGWKIEITSLAWAGTRVSLLVEGPE